MDVNILTHHKKYYGFPNQKSFIYCYPWDQPFGTVELEGPPPDGRYTIDTDGKWTLDPSLTKKEHVSELLSKNRKEIEEALTQVILKNNYKSFNDLVSNIVSQVV